ncbi:hypothetical protein [Pseudodesulfovibrio piezophilus]|uniref:Uncharacterized protein n=1 Tax=Pseudodesulfovibrio piezophilus (strain DSM 21447 / JCM 15486 / C1TLV30) TaxID=1322246 RepID=M1WJL8_PSEP2|nr:hypothetical protein [Pseudodesulfovibrio piezophilus]CCH48121.1 conserved membrane protein of unknown function [Pseudodesulfovibrio piezophilus C1TLV30]
MLPKLDIKEKHFHGILIVGGMAGLLEGMMRDGFTLHTMFPGMMLTLVAAFLGGFSGFFIKDLTRTWRGMAPYRGVNNDGWIMGAFMGTFLGTLYQIIDSANGANLVIGSMFGAYFGAMCGAFPDEFITPILRLMHAEKAARKLTESEQQISSRS